jgi:hypothetical protein
LSEGELRLLANSATKLGSWAITDSDGKVIGYKTSESSFKKELDSINNFAKIDYIKKGGSPLDLDKTTVTSDGKIWSLNSDGSLTQLN